MAVAREINLFSITLLAAADFSAKQYYFAKVDSNGKAAVAGAGEKAIGVIQQPVGSGERCRIMVEGITFVEASAAIAAGAEVASASDGRAVTKSGTAISCGVALNAVSNAGEIVAVLLQASNEASGYAFLQIDHSLATLDNMEVLTDFTPGFAGSIESIHAVVTTATTDTTGHTAELSLEIGSTAVTGGALTIADDVAAQDPDTIGKVIDGTAITAGNTFTATDTISIVAADVTPFTDGAILIVVKLSY